MFKKNVKIWIYVLLYRWLWRILRFVNKQVSRETLVLVSFFSNAYLASILAPAEETERFVRVYEKR